MNSTFVKVWLHKGLNPFESYLKGQTGSPWRCDYLMYLLDYRSSTMDSDEKVKILPDVGICSVCLFCLLDLVLKIGLWIILFA